MRKRTEGRVHSPGLVRRMLEYVRGREQLLVRGMDEWPLLLLSYPTGSREVAEDLRDAWLHTLPALHTPLVGPYRAMLPQLPSVVVILLRRRNVCTCLGHHHPAGTESRLTRRIAADTGGRVGEIDLAWEAIREWQPSPLASLAAAVAEPGFGQLQSRTALLTILLHELEHLSYPDRAERTVRMSSDEFYSAMLSELLCEEGFSRYGIIRTSTTP